MAETSALCQDCVKAAIMTTMNHLEKYNTAKKPVLTVPDILKLYTEALERNMSHHSTPGSW